MKTVSQVIETQREKPEMSERWARSLSTIEKPKSILSVPVKSAYKCDLCKDMGYFSYDVPVGHPKFGKAHHCTGEAHSVKNNKHLAKSSGMLLGDLNIRMEDILPVAGNEKMLAVAAQKVAQPSGLVYIFGQHGNAKTEMAMAMVNRLNEANPGMARYSTFESLLGLLRSSFKDTNGYLNMYSKIKETPFLVIDEMDKVKNLTDFAHDFRTGFLDFRYRQAVNDVSCTVMISNKHPDEFLPDEILSRVMDSRFDFIQNTADGFRQVEQVESSFTVVEKV